MLRESLTTLSVPLPVLLDRAGNAGINLALLEEGDASLRSVIRAERRTQEEEALSEAEVLWNIALRLALLAPSLLPPMDAGAVLVLRPTFIKQLTFRALLEASGLTTDAEDEERTAFGAFRELYRGMLHGLAEKAAAQIHG